MLSRVPRAAEFVKPHLDATAMPLVKFANQETKALNQKQEADMVARAPLDRRLAALSTTASVMLYACGPEGMLAATAKTAARHGRPCQVSVERIMGCGLGGCYSCVVLTRQAGAPPHFVRSCIEGPVFEADRILWEALAH